MDVKSYIRNHITYLDGGMGTILQGMGLAPSEAPERWNLTHPERIIEVHRRYFEAGSNIVSTNTFGANLLKFSPEELDQIVGAAVENVRRAAAACGRAQEKWVALDIGPSGKLLKPYGDLDFEDAVALFAETVKLGVKYGVDLIFIETMNDSYETKAALLAAKENANLPVFVSNAYGEDGKLMTGASPAAMVALLEGMHADAIGVNCSLGPKALAGVVGEYLTHASVPVLMKPNAGLPRSADGKTVYDVLPDEFAADVTALIEKGVHLAGGCCGTTPDYIAALTARSAGLTAKPIEEKNTTVVSSYTHAVAFSEVPILIGERINPTGKKRFQEALRAGDIDYILKEGLGEAECGAHILDVNVGLPGIDEPAMLQRVVTELQAILDLPLQIDTSDPAAMEAALRRYNGKAMINSVSGKQESMDAVFPLVQKYGGLCVALTLDENGIPETAEGRVAIAGRILAEAAKYGISGKDLIFDPLAMTVSADNRAAVETLRAVDTIRHTLGCHTSLGVSNVSFGVPRREILNGAFFTLAMGKGLSAAIMNPHSEDMMRAYHAYLALAGLDENCAGYIEFAASLPEATAGSAPAAPKATGICAHTDLQRAIVKGLREEAATLTASLLETTEPLTLVQEEIIPALDAVGVGFEQKTVYLPGLLMSAEAAGAAFAVIKEKMPAAKPAYAGSILLATVHGDIHDIGKNIVKLLLENYGFSVVDLGRDVPPEAIAARAVELHAPLVGLSALMTTTVPAMEVTIRLLRERAPRCKIVVGGAVLTRAYAETIGADHYAKDAMETVRYAKEVLAGQ